MAAQEEEVPAVQIFQGTIIHSTAENDLDINENSVLLVERGRVKRLVPAHELQDLLQETGASSEDVIQLDKHQFLMPGLVDTHIHASQYPNAGLAMDLSLLDWLDQYTFPMEAHFEDEEFAKEVYSTCVDRTLKAGTTCASYFATIHRPASEILVDVCRDRGQRAFVGKVNMDRNSPHYYCEKTDESIQETIAFVNNVLAGADGRSGLVQPSITPRFAISTTDRLLNRLGELTQERNLHAQTHCNECVHEKAFVKKLFPSSTNYVDVYRTAGLLGPRTVLAHCIHILKDELNMIKDTETGVAHCPASNINIRSGLCDVMRLDHAGIKIGIGTDVSGGYSPSILDGFRVAVHTSKVHAIQRPGYEPLHHGEGFRMATLGGAAALGLADQIGNFLPGKQLDALLVSLGDRISEVSLLKPMSTDELLQKFLYLGDSRDIKHVYVAGRQVI